MKDFQWTASLQNNVAGSNLCHFYILTYQRSATEMQTINKCFRIWQCKHLVHVWCFAHKRTGARFLDTAVGTVSEGTVQRCNISLHDWTDKKRNSTSRNLGCVSDQSTVQHIRNCPGNKIFSGLFQCKKSSVLWRKNDLRKWNDGSLSSVPGIATLLFHLSLSFLVVGKDSWT